jgi:hypothetical protein
MVEHRVSQQQVERVILEGQRGGLASRCADAHAEARGRAVELVEHSLRDVGGHRLVDHAREEQVEGEVAGAGPDLERAPERPRVGPEGLSQLPEHLLGAALVVGDAPLRVVVRGGDVVVAGVDVLDVVGGERRHGGGTISAIRRYLPRAWQPRRNTRSGTNRKAFPR